MFMLRSLQRRAQKPKRILVVAPNDQCFWLESGPMIKDLNELKHALETMSDDQFAHHVNSERNDFANWVHNVLDDTELSGKLKRCKTRLSTLRSVSAHIAKNYAV